MVEPRHLSSIERTAYRLTQNLRQAWYSAQYAASQRLSQPVPLPDHLKGAMPPTARLNGDRDRLIARDLGNIEAGFYRLPHDMIQNPVTALHKSFAYFADLRAINRKKLDRDRSILDLADTDGFPDYYRQAFHNQTDGYLSERSARLYDFQVEVLFGGAVDAMRRQALVPLHHFLRGRRTADCRLIDLACGTGRFLTFVKDNYSRLAVTALDISPPYLAEARRNLRPWSRVEFIEGAIESVALPSSSFDIATCVYLFHELPADLHVTVARKIADILKPGGLLVFIDSLQLGDRPDYDPLLESFPMAFHEPYYGDYLRQDLRRLFQSTGLEIEQVEFAYLSRVMVMLRAA